MQNGLSDSTNMQPGSIAALLQQLLGTLLRLHSHIQAALTTHAAAGVYLVPHCRSVKLSTWLGGWYEGGQAWRQDYVAGIEDPFDSSDNTARTLGTAVRTPHNAPCDTQRMCAL